jgi:ABC-type transport system involved in multi-copper enzyme maturation permease subunit
MKLNLSKRRIGAIYRKDWRELRRNKMIIATLIYLPLVLVIPPTIDILVVPAVSSQSNYAHILLYLLAIPILVPAQLAAFTVVAERQQGTLEPVLGTPIRREEFLLGKALALIGPAIAASFGVYAVVIAIIELFAHPGVAGEFVQPQNILAQVIFTPLLAAWSIWVGMTISSRCADQRVAGQLSLVGTLPLMAITVLMAYGVIPSTLLVGVIGAAALLVLDTLGWRMASLAFDRERMITARGIRRRGRTAAA